MLQRVMIKLEAVTSINRDYLKILFAILSWISNLPFLSSIPVIQSFHMTDFLIN